MQETTVIRPQEGYQMMALSSSADIVIGGGAAGAGKTFSLLLDFLRSIENKDFGGVIFRRTTPQITNEGGLWDESGKLYPLTGAVANETKLHWRFPTGCKMKFTHLQYEKDLKAHQGSQICFMGFDELTHFTKNMFFYMLSRNRSTSGVKPCVRATCNPDPDSWVYDLISWWIGEDGLPDPSKQGIIRYFVKDGENMIWGDSREECELKAKYFLDPLIIEAKKKGVNIDKRHFVKSITFIGGSIYDNGELLRSNPEYLGNLAAQSADEKKRLLDGNWKVSINPADIYNYTKFKDSFNNTFVKEGEGRITVDVAMMGGNKLIINYFKGHRWEDIDIIDKSSGKDVVDAIKKMQNKYSVPNSKVTYDANGVGAFIGGEHNAFIPGAKPFDNASKAIDNTDDSRNFKNKKAQCYYLSGDRFDRNEAYISPSVANRMYDDKMTVRQRLMFERKAIKKAKRMDEEPHGLIKKEEMKSKYLSGDSPDLTDSLMMNEIFELDNHEFWAM